MLRTTRRNIAAGPVLVLSFILINVLAQSASQTQRPRDNDDYESRMEAADANIRAEIERNSELMANLEYLTTQIGPRLTGSPQMEQASLWALQRFRDYGIDAHLEEVQVPRAWTRGNESAEIVSPISRRIAIHSVGWGRPTSGEVAGKVVILEDPQPDGFTRSMLEGAMVLLGEPARVSLEDAANAYDSVIPPRRTQKPGQDRPPDLGRLLSMLEGSNPAAVLLDVGKPYNLFTMASSGRYETPRYSQAYLAHEDYSLLYRLARKAPVVLRINLPGTFSPGPQKSSITVAEIKGDPLPGERVIIGAHLDSWDLGQGALDNGTGCVAVLEAARALKRLGFQPRRTITFVLFTGEEQGGLGVDAYLKNHAPELSRIDAVLIHDTGTGRVLSISLQNLWEAAPLMEQIYRPLQEVFDLEPLTNRYFGGSDHVAFLAQGVPAFFCVQRSAHYREAHHSQTDTFDKVIPDEINQGAAVLAAWAWNVSESIERLPHSSR